MEKLFVPYEIAVLAKEKGFNERCFGWWFADGSSKEPHLDYYPYQTEVRTLAPIYQQLVDCFEKEYRIKIRKIPTTSGNDWWSIWMWDKDKVLWRDIFKRPENIDEAIKEAFKLI